MERYILVEWPESQEFIGREGCYYCSPEEDEQLDQAMFVPEDLYCEVTLIMRNISLGKEKIERKERRNKLWYFFMHQL